MKYIFFLLICFLSAFSLRAQDRIVTIQGDEILCKVKIVDTAFIHYSPKDTTFIHNAPKGTAPDTIVYTKEMQKIRIADVFMITYANGSKDVFTENLPGEKPEETNSTNAIASNNEMYALGQEDAKQRFDGTGAFVAGFIGLIPGAIVAVTTPQISPSKVSDPSLIKDDNYRRGYKKAASNKKLKNAAAGYAAGRIATIMFFIVVALTL